MIDQKSLPSNDEILVRAQTWFRKTIVDSHFKRTEKLGRPSEFSINPFLAPYLSAFTTGSVSAEGVARALVLSRALGPSISTSFGGNLQSFISDVLPEAKGSLTSGVDIEFTDRIDDVRRYAQLKLGPQTINKDDVKTICDHFDTIKGLARQNKMPLPINSLVVCVLYGTNRELNANYKALQNKHHHSVLVGSDFWHRLTGDEDFYYKLIQAISSTLGGIDGVSQLDGAIKRLSRSETIRQITNQAIGSTLSKRDHTDSHD